MTARSFIVVRSSLVGPARMVGFDFRMVLPSSSPVQLKSCEVQAAASSPDPITYASQRRWNTFQSSMLIPITTFGRSSFGPLGAGAGGAGAAAAGGAVCSVTWAVNTARATDLGRCCVVLKSHRGHWMGSMTSSAIFDDCSD